jgi:hypothetical protein
VSAAALTRTTSVNHTLVHVGRKVQSVSKRIQVHHAAIVFALLCMLTWYAARTRRCSQRSETQLLFQRLQQQVVCAHERRRELLSIL